MEQRRDQITAVLQVHHHQAESGKVWHDKPIAGIRVFNRLECADKLRISVLPYAIVN